MKPGDAVRWIHRGSSQSVWKDAQCFSSPMKKWVEVGDKVHLILESSGSIIKLLTPNQEILEVDLKKDDFVGSQSANAFDYADIEVVSSSPEDELKNALLRLDRLRSAIFRHAEHIHKGKCPIYDHDPSRDENCLVCLALPEYWE